MLRACTFDSSSVHSVADIDIRGAVRAIAISVYIYIYIYTEYIF